MTEATKPVVRKVRPRHVPHGVKPLLCVTLFADGTLLLKEHGRRSGGGVVGSRQPVRRPEDAKGGGMKAYRDVDRLKTDAAMARIHRRWSETMKSPGTWIERRLRLRKLWLESMRTYALLWKVRHYANNADEAKRALAMALRCHRTIWAELAAMYQARVVIEVAVVGQRLKDKGKLEEVGGVAGLSALLDGTPSAASLSYFLDVLIEKARRRELIQLAGQARELAADDAHDPAALLSDFTALAETLASRNGHVAPTIQTVGVDDVLDYKPAPRAWLIGADMVCLGEFSVLAGLPEAGKSMLANTLAVAGAECRGEWMGYEIRRRFKTLVLQSEGSMRRMQKELARANRERMRDYVRFTPPTHLKFGDPEFRRALRQMHADWPFDLLVIDNWSDCVLDDKFADYQQGLDNIRAALPDGDDMPAVLIVAHLSKAVIKAEKPMSGRSLMAHVSGSFRLGQKARTVFTLVRAYPEENDDDTVIFDCAKASNDTPLPVSAWHRKPLAFEPIRDFDFNAWFNPPENAKRGGPSEAQMVELFQEGRRVLRKAAAAKELEGLGYSRASVYRYLDTEKGPFAGRLSEKDGMLTWQ